MKKIIIISIAIILLIGIVFISGCGDTTADNSNHSTKTTIAEPTSTEPTTEEETLIMYYQDDESINKFLNNFNTANPDYIIEEDEFCKYYHHGRDHDNQIKIYKDNFEIVVTDGTKIVVSSINGSETTTDDYKKLFFKLAKTRRIDFEEETLNGYWQQTLDDLINTVEFEEFECSLTIYDDKITMMTIEYNY